MNDSSSPGVHYRSPKESQIEESHSEETKIDLDYPPTNRKERDSRLDPKLTDAGPRQYPQLREALADYMATADDRERVYPTDRQVVDVMDAAGGASEAQVVECLRYLYFERGLHPGTKHGPRHFSWFTTVVAEYFEQRSHRAQVTNSVAQPAGRGLGLSKADFESMTKPLEIDDV